MNQSNETTWGWLPGLSVCAAFGLLVIAFADRAGIAGAEFAEPIFWLGLAILFVPIAARLVGASASRPERIGLVVVLGMAMYAVKFMHSPYDYTFSDELLHLYNAEETLRTHHLFNANPILQITPFYPGLQTAVAALSTLSGLAPFHAGIIVIGAARLLLILALFLFFQVVSGSARVAGLATLLYMTNANFLFWLAQLSYQSLALPLALVFIFLIARNSQVEFGARRLGLDICALLILLAVVATHHLTTYAVIAFLWAMTILFLLFNRGRQSSPWLYAVLGYAAAFFWLNYVAPLTIDYLSPLFVNATQSLMQVASGQQTGRELFRSSSGTLAPLWERISGIGSVALTLLATPLGLVRVWQNHRRNPFAMSLALMTPLYFGLLLLRLTGASWEIGNRSAMFLYIGVAFVMAVGIVEFRRSATERAKTPARTFAAGATALFVALLAAFVFIGSVIAGWPPNDRVPRPYSVAVGNRLLEPPGVTASKWVRTFLGTGNRIVSDGSNARLLLAYGQQYTLTSDDAEMRQLLTASAVNKPVRDTLRFHGIAFVFFDRRQISWDHMVGTFFDRRSDVIDGTVKYFDSDVVSKFDHQAAADRIFDGGNIVIYDVRGFYAAQ